VFDSVVCSGYPEYAVQVKMLGQSTRVDYYVCQFDTL
jgi:hypothetical protein